MHPPSARPAPEEAPLFAGAIHGVRGWNVRQGRLAAPYRDTLWRPGQAMRATCDVHPEPPARDCGCGLYAFHPHSRRVDAHHHDVLGVVEAWGRIELYADGFRAEHARPVALFVREAALGDERARVELLALRYRCEVIRLGRRETPAEACAARGWGIGERTVAELLAAVHPPGDRFRGPAPRRRRSRVSRIAEAVAAAARWAGVGLAALLVGIVWLAFYGALAASVVIGALWLLGVDVPGESGDGPPPLVRTSDVEVTGAWTVEFGCGARVHAVELINRGERAALGARPALAEVADGKRDEVGALNVAVPVHLAPGERGLALHPVASDDPGARAEPGRVWAREGPAYARAPALLAVRIERRGRRCAAVARVHAERPLARLAVWALRLGDDGRPEELIGDALRDVPAGRSERVLDRAARCPDPIPRFRVYPAFRKGQLVTASDGR